MYELQYEYYIGYKYRKCEPVISCQWRKFSGKKRIGNLDRLELSSSGGVQWMFLFWRERWGEKISRKDGFENNKWNFEIGKLGIFVYSNRLVFFFFFLDTLRILSKIFVIFNYTRINIFYFINSRANFNVTKRNNTFEQLLILLQCILFFKQVASEVFLPKVRSTLFWYFYEGSWKASANLGMNRYILAEIH